MNCNNFLFFLLYLFMVTSSATPHIYSIKFLVINFLGANFLTLKRDHHRDNQLLFGALVLQFYAVFMIKSAFESPLWQRIFVPPAISRGIPEKRDPGPRTLGGRRTLGGHRTLGGPRVLGGPRTLWGTRTLLEDRTLWGPRTSGRPRFLWGPRTLGGPRTLAKTQELIN